ncbi:hypothetical protein CEY00_Acc04662 [Actinidia chinensis var. chinensis]|uniref:LysM domain receptor-like kinase n=1 Tax=Actinidia chinensis var. chinensis TaxID=1590841 RepID=A0A2R6RMW1_ACTCC|nr:hypothetical protein CEY00_Acc04662 [Actinidia chinensis var. chinensis]
MKPAILCLFTLACLVSSISTQQEYSENSVLNCNNSDENKPSPAFLYTCNGLNTTCKAFLIFKSEPPYNSAPSISALTSSSPSELARANNVTNLTIFPTGKEVIVPVNCSCFGQYYLANSTFRIPTVDDTYFSIANNTFQGLSTCDSLKRANQYSEYELDSGLELLVPLRCACPTRKQISEGTKNLLTYSLYWDDNVPDIAERFNVSAKSVLEANGFSEEDPTLFPFTTILIPLSSEPSSSNTVIHRQKPIISSSHTTATKLKGSKRKVYLAIGIAAGSLLILSIPISITLFLFRKKRKFGVLRNSGEKGKQKLPKDLLVEIASIDQVLRVFKFEELKKGTDNFSSQSRIKGSVYRGMFNREVLAVKKMGTNVSKEVNILNKINHFNLIKLHGFCQRRGYFYLVFDYMENGSLREWLRKKSPNETKSWSQRIQIALDVANGLHYLHSYTNPVYVHKNIKSGNILLDRNLRAKIVNFSLARTVAKGTNSSVTAIVEGTRGYLAPEYVEKGLVTPKVDVYAFGVVMLELIVGKEAVFEEEGREVLLSAAVGSIMEGENAETELGLFVDPGLGDNGGTTYALRVARLSLMCLSRDPEGRPSMAEVVSVLLRLQVDLQNS